MKLFKLKDDAELSDQEVMEIMRAWIVAADMRETLYVDLRKDIQEKFEESIS